MGFLSGVLSNIYKHLGQHKETITDAINTLNTNKHLGKKGFNVAIGSVVEGVGRYNEKVKRSNENVSTPIKIFHDYIESEFNNTFETIEVKSVSADPDNEDNQVKAATDLAEACLGKAKDFCGAINENKDNVNDLNHTLMLKVYDVKDCIEHEIKRLSELSTKEKKELEEMSALVKKMLSELKKQINEEIEMQVRSLVKHLKSLVTKIRDKLIEVEHNMQQYVYNLATWMEDAQRILDEALRKVAVILGDIDGTGSMSAERIKTTADLIQTEAGLLHRHFESAKSEYEKLFKLIKGKSGDGNDEECVIHMLDDAENKVNEPKSLEGFKKTDEWGLKNEIEGLTKAIHTNVENYLKYVKEALEAGIQKADNFSRTTTPGLNAMIDHLGEDIKGKLGTFGLLFTTAKSDTEKGGLGYCFEILLYYLNSVKKDNAVGWERFVQLIGTNVTSSMKDRSIAGDFNEKLLDLVNGAVINGMGNLQEAVTAIVQDKLKPLKDEISSIIQQAEESKNAIRDHAADVLGRFAELSANITNAGGNAMGILQDLRNTNIGVQLKKIKKQINTLQSVNLPLAIELSHTFVSREADDAGEGAITVIKNVVENQVDNVSRALTTQTRKHYVTTMRLLLDAFAAKVTAELTNLPEAIEKDMHIGFKGFMEAFAGDNDRNIKLLEGQNDAKRLQDLSYAFNASWQPMHDYLNKEIKRVTNENNKRNPKSEDPQPYLTGLSKITESLNALLTHVTDKNKYDCQIPGLLDSLESAVSDLTPQGFSNPNSAILDGITSGLGGLIGELRKTYISTYDGAKQISWDELFANKETEESRHAAKVCMSIFKVICDDLTELHKQCTEQAEWKGRKIYETSDARGNPLGDFFLSRGYKIPSANSNQDGELQCSVGMMGRHILRNLNTNIQDAHYNVHLKDCRGKESQNRFNIVGIITCIIQHVNQYYMVCHLPTVQSSKLPCNIYQMLSWLCGLTYNPVYPQLSLNAFSDFFEKPEHSAPADSEDVSFDDDTADALPAYPHEVSVANLSTTLMEVCHHSYEVLCAILGHGHAGGRYACDFNTNPDKLSYPSNPSKCLDLCIEILIRLYNQLYFIYVQCHRASNAVSWRDCYYGRHVGGSSWECNEIQCADLIANQRGAQKCNQNADQTCEQHPKCGIKSPLQSFLEDGLPGFLPHPFKTPNCKLTCEAPNHRGIPCKTPMGFADISVTASHTKKGSHLADALAAFCGTPNTPLAAICASLTCLLQRAPRTLDDMFSFYYHLLKGWNGNNSKRNMHKSNAFNDAVSKAHFGEAYPDLDITTIFKGSDHKTGNHVNGELHSLFTCDYGNKTEMECGRYMQPFGHNIWTVFSEVNADKYLTWIVYLTEAFYDLLKKLYEECCKNCKTPGSRCHGKTCHQNCLVSHTSTHSKNCRSIAQCPFTRPTLCKYGFVFQSESNLSGTYGPETKRTCQDFCNALNKVLKKGNVLGDLTYITIPNFLWKIREKFFWLNVALWLLSLLYLIHIMVIRLDLLHIKSHLNSPSSHRIAAQSLLAAARVNKLNRVFYLQP
ncbi:hypothetical protein, conserved [Babesia bigemina]|uniref:C3H1-type domain-containing protein n=1 Tax=Babesia bigemina TaxID=5866 RepID=A0A061BTQ0_BABBI|nr:hypothetical protein, conserved [Babesia bigemina]CDR71864.1 hypothetical protein, conserved [Babesia bigemina]|eukprot:XP_012770807.1 hypothetical protein, conserved [Babesia bigemina]